MTTFPAAVDALVRLDDGLPLPGDAVLLAVFDRHCQWGALIPCVICGQAGGPECARCTADHDYAVARSSDV